MFKLALIIVTLSLWVLPVEADPLKISETVKAWKDFQDETKPAEVRQKAADDFVDCLQGKRGLFNSNKYHSNIREMRKKGENRINIDKIRKGTLIQLSERQKYNLWSVENSVKLLLSQDSFKMNIYLHTLGDIRSMITDPWQDLSLCRMTMDKSWNDPDLHIPLYIKRICRIEPGIFSFGENASRSWYLSYLHLIDLRDKFLSERSTASRLLETYVSQIKAKYDEQQKQNLFVMEPMGENLQLDQSLEWWHRKLPKALKGELVQDEIYQQLLADVNHKCFLYREFSNVTYGIRSLREDVLPQKKAFVTGIIPAMTHLFYHKELDSSANNLSIP